MEGEDNGATKAKQNNDPSVPGSCFPRIVVLNTETNDHQFELSNEETLLGRGISADIQINVPSVSREHAMIRRLYSGNEVYYTLTDLGSSNGTKVNGAFVAETRLQSGDEVQLGEVKVKFYV